MSIGVEKKRGKKTTTRANSTKAEPKTAKATTSASKASRSTKPTPELEAKPAATRKSAPKCSSSTPPSPKSETPKPETKPSTKSPQKVTPETSKVLNELRQLTAKTGPRNSSSPPQPPATATSSTPPPIKPTPSSPPKPTAPASKLPIAGLNKKIVGDIATRAGARPNAGGPGGALPKNYKSVANKVTMAIVALPVALVTSWILYERLALGEERKLLVKPKMPPKEEASSTS